MNKRLEKLFYLIWIESLTFLAGAINICAMVLYGMTITHYTGNISNAAIAIGSGQILILNKFLSYIVLFFLGSVIAGLLSHEQKSGLRKYHGIIPILFGIIILVIYKYFNSNVAILRILAFGMGIQNGTCKKIDGVLVRTTHMTGYITDAAFSLVSIIRGHSEQAWKLRFYLISISVYFAGGLASLITIKMIGSLAIAVVAILYILHGIIISLGFVVGIDKDNILDEQLLPDEDVQMHTEVFCLSKSSTNRSSCKEASE